MPRIRTLKPEHRQHRKIGPLSDRAYRLWVGMICEADDHGRLVADPVQLRALIWPYHSRVSRANVEQALAEIEATGLINLYSVDGVQYACFPSWGDHQKVDHPAKSKLPECHNSENPRESSRILANVRGGSEGIGSEGKGSPNPSPADQAPPEPSWGRPEDLVDLYNRLAPPGLGQVTRLSPARRGKASKYLNQFPDREFWVRAFSELRLSCFLQGLHPTPGHDSFRGDFDWLLCRGKDGSENVVKVAEGRYRDKEA